MSLTPEQIELRRQGLTASDIVVLSGTVPFKKARTVFDLYLDKVHPEQLAPTEVTEAMELGHAAEPMIVSQVAKRLNVAIVYPQTTVRHHRIEWAMATPDAMIVEGVEPAVIPEASPIGTPAGLVECKLVGLYMSDSWDYADDGKEGIPSYVVTQCVWQCFVKNLPYVQVAAMIGTQIRIHRLDMDAGMLEYAAALVEIGEKFLVDHVRPKRPPTVDGSESARRMLAGIFPRSNGNLLAADTEAECAAKMYFEGVQLEKEGQRLKNDAKSILMEKIQDGDGVKSRDWRALWRNQAGYRVDGYDVPEGRRWDMRVVHFEAGRCR